MPKSKLGSDVPLLNPRKSKKTPLQVFFVKLMIKITYSSIFSRKR